MERNMTPPILLLLWLLLPTIVTSQSLVLIGGGLTDDNAPIWEKMVELAGGKGVANIGIFSTASSDPAGSYDYYNDMFVNVYGANSTTFIPVTEASNNADDPAVATMVSQQSGLFFGGGDQARVTAALRPEGRDTLVLTAVKNLFRAGAMVGGSSAGSMCQSEAAMITGGNTYEGLVYGSHPGGEDPSNPSHMSYNEYGGIGLLPGYVIDTHFSERGREARLIRLLQDTRNLPGIGSTRGFGIDEDTALVISNVLTNPVGTVIGTTGGVFFADVTNLVENPSSTTDYERATTHYITNGDSIDLTTGAIRYASGKSPLKGQEALTSPPTSSDILSWGQGRQWAVVAQGLFDSVTGDTSSHLSHEKKPQFQVTLDRQAGEAYYADVLVGSPPKNARLISYENLQVAIREKI